MTRRLQLLDPEIRSSGRRVSVVFRRIRDGFLHDNKVMPAVLGILALLIFAWLIAGALIGSLGGEEEQQASNQVSLAQGEDSYSGDSEKPAPGADNRDSDASYGGYDEGPKDPFRNIINKTDEGTSGGQNGSQGSSQGSSRGGNHSDRNGGDRNVGSADIGTGDNGQGSNRGRTGADRGRDDSEGYIEQSSPGDPGFQGAPGGGGAGQGGLGQGGANQAGAGQGGGLFNSGGDLPKP